MAQGSPDITRGRTCESSRADGRRKAHSWPRGVPEEKQQGAVGQQLARGHDAVAGKPAPHLVMTQNHARRGPTLDYGGQAVHI